MHTNLFETKTYSISKYYRRCTLTAGSITQNKLWYLKRKPEILYRVLDLRFTNFFSYKSRTIASASHPWPPSPVLQPAGRTHSAPESTTTHSPTPVQPQVSSPAPHASRPPLPSWVPPSNSELLCWTRRNSAPVLWPPLHHYAPMRLPGKLFYFEYQGINNSYNSDKVTVAKY